MPDNGLSEADEKEVRESVETYLDQFLMPLSETSKKLMPIRREMARSLLVRMNHKYYRMDSDGVITCA